MADHAGGIAAIHGTLTLRRSVPIRIPINKVVPENHMGKFQFILLSSALVVIAYVLLLVFKIRQSPGKHAPKTQRPVTPPDTPEIDSDTEQAARSQDKS